MRGKKRTRTNLVERRNEGKAAQREREKQHSVRAVNIAREKRGRSNIASERNEGKGRQDRRPQHDDMRIT